jgi:hypothetical protein
MTRMHADRAETQIEQMNAGGRRLALGSVDLLDL